MGEKHPLGLVEGATENAAMVQALLDNLVARGLDPAVMRAVHHRRRQGPVLGDPPHLWQEHADPALPGSQGPEHCRASA